MSEPAFDPYFYLCLFKFYFCAFGFLFNFIFVYFHFSKITFATQVSLIEVTSGGRLRVILGSPFSNFQGSPIPWILIYKHVPPLSKDVFL